MAVMTWESVLNFPQSGVLGASYNTSVALTDVTPAPQVFILANSLVVGSVIKITAFGTMANGSTTPTLLIGVYYGGVAGVSLAGIQPTAMTATATPLLWRMEYVGVVRSVGATGTIVGSGKILFGTSLTAATILPLPSVTLAPITIDTTTAKAITVGAQWGTSSASNIFQVQGFVLESKA